MFDLSHVFHSFSDATRLHIIRLLEQYENICVSELATATEISVAATSQHLRVLELSGVVRRERHGQKNCYQLQTEDPLIRDLLTVIHNTEMVYG